MATAKKKQEERADLFDASPQLDDDDETKDFSKKAEEEEDEEDIDSVSMDDNDLILSTGSEDNNNDAFLKMANRYQTISKMAATFMDHKQDVVDFSASSHHVDNGDSDEKLEYERMKYFLHFNSMHHKQQHQQHQQQHQQQQQQHQQPYHKQLCHTDSYKTQQRPPQQQSAMNSEFNFYETKALIPNEHADKKNQHKIHNCNSNGKLLRKMSPFVESSKSLKSVSPSEEDGQKLSETDTDKVANRMVEEESSAGNADEGGIVLEGASDAANDVKVKSNAVADSGKSVEKTTSFVTQLSNRNSSNNNNNAKSKMYKDAEGIDNDNDDNNNSNNNNNNNNNKNNNNNSNNNFINNQIVNNNNNNNKTVVDSNNNDIRNFNFMRQSLVQDDW